MHVVAKFGSQRGLGRSARGDLGGSWADSSWFGYSVILAIN